MPPLDDYLSDSESARICGVSINTLNRFISTGYLKVEHDHDGLRLFSKNQLRRVFGVSESAFHKNIPSTKITASNAAAKLEVAMPNPQANKEEPKSPHLRVVNSNDQNLEVELSPLPSSNRESDLHAAPSATETETITTNNQDMIAGTVKTSIPPSVLAQKDLVAELNSQIESLSLSIRGLEAEMSLKDAEKSKFENIILLLEKMLDIRESEIDSLKRQQKWLEERVEKMEERSKREQLLLLAESETVRKLVIFQKRSPVRAALEWLGLAESTENRSTIDSNR